MASRIVLELKKFWEEGWPFIRKHPSLIVSLVASILSLVFSIYCIFYGSKELSKIALITALCASTGGLCCFLLFGRPLY